MRDLDRVRGVLGTVAESVVTDKCCTRCSIAAVPAGVTYAYFHSQDIDEAFDARGRLVESLFVGFGADDDREAVDLGAALVGALAREGFATDWDGTLERRIEVTSSPR